MQTFLPYPSFEKSLKSLDSKRLGKQRVEAFQILNILLGRTKTRGWRNHPSVKMWVGYENALKNYFNISLNIWIKRGYKNTMKKEEINGIIKLPPWFGDKTFHASHRSNLLRKNFDFYSKFKWAEKSDLEYIWPINT